MIKAKLLTKHNETCRAISYVKKGHWPNPWFIKGKVSFGSVRSPLEKRGRTAWLHVTCNVMDCPGEIAIKQDEILNQLKIKRTL